MNNSTGSDAQGRLIETIARNTMVVSVGGWVARLLNFLFSLYTARMLGDAGLGSYATVVAFASIAGTFFEWGMAQYVERSMAQDRTRIPLLFWTMVQLRLIFAFVGIIFTFAVALLLGYSPTIVQGIALYTGTFILAALLHPLTIIFTANERFDLSTLGQLLNQFASMIVGVICIELGWGFLGLLLTGFVAMPIQIALSLSVMRRVVPEGLGFVFVPQTWGTFLRSSLPFGVSALALNANFNTDTLLLGFFHGVNAVGWYNAAYRLIFTLVSIADGFLTVMTPSLARQYTTSPDEVARWSNGALRWMALLAFPIVVGTVFLADPLIALFYGAAFAPTSGVLAWLVWDVPLLLFTAFCGNICNAIGREGTAARVYTFGAGANLICNILLIPALGVQGAVVATLLSDGMAAIGFVVVLSNYLALVQLLPRLLLIALACMGMVITLFVVRSLPLWLVVPIGGIVYLALAIPFRLISLADLPRRFSPRTHEDEQER